MTAFILTIALLVLGATLALMGMLDTGLSNAGRYACLALATLAWLASYPLMF